MPPTSSEEQSLAVIAVELKHIREDVAELRADLRDGHGRYVPRDLYEARVQRTDNEMSRLEALIHSKRMPWPSVGALALAALAIVITLAQSL